MFPAPTAYPMHERRNSHLFPHFSLTNTLIVSEQFAFISYWHVFNVLKINLYRIKHQLILYVKTVWIKCFGSLLFFMICDDQCVSVKNLLITKCKETTVDIQADGELCTYHQKLLNSSRYKITICLTLILKTLCGSEHL